MKKLVTLAFLLGSFSVFATDYGMSTSHNMGGNVICNAEEGKVPAGSTEESTTVESTVIAD